MHDIDFRSAGKAHLISNLKIFSSGRSYESPSHKPTPLASHVADLRTARDASHHLLKPQETKTQHIPNELSKTSVRSLPNQLDARTCESNSPSITKVRFSGKVRRRSYFDFDEDKTSPRGPFPLGMDWRRNGKGKIVCSWDLLARYKKELEIKLEPREFFPQKRGGSSGSIIGIMYPIVPIPDAHNATLNPKLLFPQLKSAIR